MTPQKFNIDEIKTYKSLFIYTFSIVEKNKNGQQA